MSLASFCQSRAEYCISWVFFCEGFISRVKPSRKFPLQFMSIYGNENIRKITKLTPRELSHLVQNRENKVRENNGIYSKHNGVNKIPSFNVRHLLCVTFISLLSLVVHTLSVESHKSINTV